MEKDRVHAEASRARELLERHVRLQKLTQAERDELRRILGDALLRGWLSEGVLDDFVRPMVDSLQPGRVAVRVVLDERPAEGPAEEGRAA